MDIKTIDCGKETAYAAFCVRATGTFTVPHVFFNEEYLGNATEFMGMDATCKAGYNKMRQKLLDLAMRPSPDPPFPPAPDASMIKVTDGLAFSSQPTSGQLAAMRSFGLASLLNILRHDSPAYSATEGATAKGAGVQYKESPLLLVTASNVLKVLAEVAALPRPVLVHDDVGISAGLVVLLAAANEMLLANPKQPISSATVMEWASGLKLDIDPYRAVVDTVVAALPLTPRLDLDLDKTPRPTPTPQHPPAPARRKPSAAT